MFDTMGTVLACTTNADLNDENGKPINYGKIMKSDSLATVVGATLGTATVTTMVESGVGVAEGGKTGFTSLVTGILFILSIFLLPLFAFIPIEAAASALIYVGVLMMKNITKVDFDNIKNAVPAFLTIILMPLTYSITDGIGIGIISYTLINLIIYILDKIKGKSTKLELNIVTVIVTILFLFYFLMPII
jgi:AGZA family xanthine/uracil permease-like MFS transporter